MHHPMQGIAELPSYARLAAKLLDPQERQDLIAYLANHPEAGDLMEGTGGCVSYGGAVVGRAKAGVCEPFTTTTTPGCRSTC